MRNGLNERGNGKILMISTKQHNRQRPVSNKEVEHVVEQEQSTIYIKLTNMWPCIRKRFGEMKQNTKVQPK